MIKIIHADVIDGLRQLPDESVQCVVTSPPYWGLRDYGTGKWVGGDPDCKHKGDKRYYTEKTASVNSAEAFSKPGVKNSERIKKGRWREGGICKCGSIYIDNQIGLEKTPGEYVAKMVEVFREVRRVLRKDGTLWLNLGASYNAAGRNGHGTRENCKQGTNRASATGQDQCRPSAENLKEKDLVPIPWLVALALQQPYIVPTCVKSEIDRAWLASMFDGEGCIGIRRFDSYRKEKQQIYQDGFVVYTVITNNDIELLERCVEITGFGKVTLKQKAESTDGRGIVSRRDSYGWRLDGNAAIEVIRAIYPYLIAKKRQAKIAYTLDKLNKNGHGSRSVPKDIQDKKKLLWNLIKSCNQRDMVNDLPAWIEEPRQEVEPGWYLRSDIIWNKPNPMPSSVEDRPTTSHEYIFLLTKSAKYFYDGEAIREPASESYISDKRPVGVLRQRVNKKSKYPDEGQFKKQDLTGNPTYTGFNERYMARNGSNVPGHSGDLNGCDGITRNRRTVWTITTQARPEAHFATFPDEIPRVCISAGTSEYGCCPSCGSPWKRIVEVTNGEMPHYNSKSEGRSDCQYGESPTTTLRTTYKREQKGWQPTCKCNPIEKPVPCVVLDPFGGSGTTAKVARELNRDAILIELSADYIKIMRKVLRLNEQLGGYND